jgi:hypothetical protein
VKESPHKVKKSSVFGAIRAEEDAAKLERRNPSMSKVLSLLRSQKPRLSYDKLLLSFDEIFSAYLKAVDRRRDWRWYQAEKRTAARCDRIRRNGSGLAHDETLGISLRKPESP